MYSTPILALILLAATPISALPANAEPNIIARNADQDTSPVPATLNHLLKRVPAVGVTCGSKYFQYLI